MEPDRLSIHAQLESLHAKYQGTGNADTTREYLILSLGNGLLVSIEILSLHIWDTIKCLSILLLQRMKVYREQSTSFLRKWSILLNQIKKTKDRTLVRINNQNIHENILSLCKIMTQI